MRLHLKEKKKALRETYNRPLVILRGSLYESHLYVIVFIGFKKYIRSFSSFQNIEKCFGEDMENRQWQQFLFFFLALNSECFLSEEYTVKLLLMM